MPKKITSKRRSWAKDDVRALKQMVKDNAPAGEIAKRLERTVAAVYRMAGTLGVSMLAARNRRLKAKRAG